MSNLTGSVRINLVFQGPSGGTTTVPQKTATLTYGESSEGSGGVPAGSVADAEIPVPFGTITAATALYITNDTTQVLNLKVNGGSDTIPIAANGGVALVQAALTDATLVTTATGPTAELERFGYFVFGDSV